MTDNQVGQCREEKVDLWRFVGLYKVLPLGKVIAWCIDVTATGWVPRQPHSLIFPSNKTMFMSHQDLYDKAKLAILVAHNRAANPALLLAIAVSSVVAWNGPRDHLMANIQISDITFSHTFP